MWYTYSVAVDRCGVNSISCRQETIRDKAFNLRSSTTTQQSSPKKNNIQHRNPTTHGSTHPRYTTLPYPSWNIHLVFALPRRRRSRRSRTRTTLLGTPQQQQPQVPQLGSSNSSSSSRTHNHDAIIITCSQTTMTTTTMTVLMKLPPWCRVWE